LFGIPPYFPRISLVYPSNIKEEITVHYPCNTRAGRVLCRGKEKEEVEKKKRPSQKLF
jgi:hypothetical protein